MSGKRSFKAVLLPADPGDDIQEISLQYGEENEVSCLMDFARVRPDTHSPVFYASTPPIKALCRLRPCLPTSVSAAQEHFRRRKGRKTAAQLREKRAQIMANVPKEQQANLSEAVIQTALDTQLVLLILLSGPAHTLTCSSGAAF